MTSIIKVRGFIELVNGKFKKLVFTPEEENIVPAKTVRDAKVGSLVEYKNKPHSVKKVHERLDEKRYKYPITLEAHGGKRTTMTMESFVTHYKLVKY
jgi:hypothetical protein